MRTFHPMRNERRRRRISVVTMVVLAASLSTSATATAMQSDPPIDLQTDEVVVTGRRLEDFAADWRSCIRDRCPPKREMDLALAYATVQLSAGDYSGGWRTLRTTKARVLRHADDLPLDVARIARAAGRMADLNGAARIGRVNAFESIDALKAGSSTPYGKVLLAKLDIGDAFATEAKFDFALAQYRRVSSEAMQKGLPAIAAEADYRRASLMVGLSPQQPMYRSLARKAIGDIISSDAPAWKPYRDAARLTELNLLPAKRQHDAMIAMLPTLTPTSPDNLMLLWAPPIAMDKIVTTAPPADVAQTWVDIQYRVAADGTVRDVSAVRESRVLDPTLRAAAIASLGSRRYAPILLSANDPGPVRYARYTFIFDIKDPKLGSRLIRRGDQPRVDVFDLGSQLVRRD